MNPKPLKHIHIRSDAGRLEALYRQVDEPAAIAVICHPHPLHGGTLHNKVVFRASKAFERAEVATLRFNFRGAGTSQGKHDEGEGEQRDVHAAIAWLQSIHPGRKLILGGFSFGAWVASRVAIEREDVEGLFLIGSPVNKYDMSYVRQYEKPMLFIQGSEDEFGDAELLGKIVERCRNAEEIIVGGADHFFRNQIEVVEQTLYEWTVRVLHGESSPRMRDA